MNDRDENDLYVITKEDAIHVDPRSLDFTEHDWHQVRKALGHGFGGEWEEILRVAIELVLEDKE